MTYDSAYSLDDLQLYNHARGFRKQIYQLIQELPEEEKYCLANQMRRAAVSITNNIAEGHGRWHYQENIQFCRISRGSIEEIVDDLNVCMDQNYGSRDHLEQLKIQAGTLIAKINSYIAYLNKSKQGASRA